MRSSARPIIPIIAVAALVAAPSALGATDGQYNGVVNGTVTNPCGGNEGEGMFDLSGSGTQIEPAGADATDGCGNPLVPQTAIIAPTYDNCNVVNARLTATSIPVVNGAFDYRGTAPLGRMGKTRKVHFKGSWVSQTKVKGTTEISKPGGGCDKREKWTMNLIP